MVNISSFFCFVRYWNGAALTIASSKGLTDSLAFGDGVSSGDVFDTAFRIAFGVLVFLAGGGAGGKDVFKEASGTFKIFGAVFEILALLAGTIYLGVISLVN